MLLASPFRPLVRHAGLFFSLWFILAAAVFAQSPSADDGFDPNVDGNVYAVATQPDGKVIIGGQFTALRPNGRTVASTRNNLARLNADGTLDETFTAGTNAPVRAIVIQPDGKILIGGDFTGLSNVLPSGSTTTEARSCIARLNVDGTVDSSFIANVRAPLSPQLPLPPQVFALALQADGSIVVGGAFGSVQPASGPAVVRRNLARFTASGALDTSYDPNPNGMVLALALHVDRKMVVGGGFTSFQENGKAAATTRNRVARLNADGTLDTEFDPNANNGVTSIAIQRDAKIVLGGYFTTLQPAGSELVTRSHIARLNRDGSLDTEFYPLVGGNVSVVAVQPDGGILVGGPFTSISGRGTAALAYRGIARFLTDGTVDTNFDPGVNADVAAIGFQADGRMVIGGLFTRVQPLAAATGIVRNHLARLNPDGSLDAGFELTSGGRPLVSLVLPDGRILVGGSFTNVGGATHNFLVRLNADGTVDPTYNPDLNGRVLAMAYEASSGKVIIGGSFTTISTARTGLDTRNHIARLNPDGSPDSEFNPNIDGDVGAIVLQSDGKILVGGNFSHVQPIGAPASFGRIGLLRLNSNGSLDTAFDPNPNSTVTSIVVQSDGKIVFGGNFTLVTPNPTITNADGTIGTNNNAVSYQRGSIARVNADGTMDTSFDAGFTFQVTALALQGDGKLLVGGTFTQVFPHGGTELLERFHIARLNADATLDTTFDPKANNNVMTIAVQSDNKILIGGTFTTLTPNGAANWIQRRYVARLNADGTVDPGFNLDMVERLGNRVDSLRIQPDGRILIGGNFDSVQPVGAPARIARDNFARINADGSLDTSFDIKAGGAPSAVINAIALQHDNKVVVAGSFSDLGGAKTTNIARFTPEGLPDYTFGTNLSTDGPVNAVAIRPSGSPAVPQLAGFAWLEGNGTLRSAFAPGSNARFAGQVRAVAVQADGSVLLGGSFTNLSNATADNLVRVKPNGELDTSFAPSIGGAVSGIVVQSDGRIVIIGDFSTINANTRNRIARLNADGSLDSYDPNPNAGINAIALQSDNKIVIGGDFTTLTPNSGSALSRNFVARINTDGSLDTNYNPNPNFSVNAIAVQSDGRVVIGGGFTSLQPNSATSATDRHYLARLNTDGTLDTAFDPNPNAAVLALAIQSDGAIVLGGAFTSFDPKNGGTTSPSRNRYYVARVRSDGSVDSFDPYTNGTVTSIAIQSDGGIVLGGTFTTLRPNGSVTPVTRQHLARVNSDGSLDGSFNPDPSGTVNTVVTTGAGNVLVGGSFTTIQPRGLILVGGSFNTIGGVAAKNVALLNDDSSVNSTFLPNPDGAVRALLVQPDGKFIVAGEFTHIGGAARNRIARFNSDGSLDTAFDPNASAPIYALALAPNGKVMVAGGFLAIGGQARNGLARLNADGSVDASFNAGINYSELLTTGLAVLPDGSIVITGDPIFGSGTAPEIRRLSPSGAVDSSFQAGQPANRALIGVPDAMAVQVDGRIILAVRGPEKRLIRLNNDGAIDATYNPAPNGLVKALALQPDGRLMIGGSFTTVGGLQRVALARLSTTGLATQALGLTSDGKIVVWERAGSGGEVAAAVFEQSIDGVTWRSLGTGTRIAQGWQVANVSLPPADTPASGTFSVRVRGIAPSVAGRSSSVFESVREFNLSSATFAPPAPGTGGAQIPESFTIDPFTGIVRGMIIVPLPGAGAPPDGTPSGDGGSGPSTTTVTRLADIAARGTVNSNTPLIAGFAIGGNEPRTVLLRAIGPGLSTFMDGVLPATGLRLFDGDGHLLLSTAGWSLDLIATFAQTGAFPLTPGSADSAVAVTLAPGTYSLHVVDTTGAGGVALAEVYDVAGAGNASRLVNLSGRGTVIAGNGAFIGGVVLTGDTSKQLLVRGIGPGLSKYGVTGTLDDPGITVYDAEGRVLATNDNWGDASVAGTGAANSAAVSAAAAQVGAFGLDVGSKDAALTITLPPGAYSVHVSGPEGATGAAMLEIYELP
jgi:uncharacterized delta-60 repeat protein